MDFDVLEKILNLLERCQSENKPLQINIDEDLVKILPLPRRLILDILSDQILFRLSDDQKILFYQNNLRLCSIDQNQGESCYSSSCEQFHLCQNYLFNKTCSEFNSLGKCSHSHSLSTNHNEKILEKYHFSSKDDRIFSFISRLIKLSLSNSSKLILQTINKQNITDQLINQWLDQHRSLLKSQKLLNSYTIELTFDDDEVSSMMEDYINQHHSDTAVVKKDFQLTNGYESLSKSFGRGRGRQQMNNVPLLNNQSNSFSPRLASSLPVTEKKFTFSQRLNSSAKVNENPSSNQTLITYKYNKPFIDEHLCYLLGPGKQQIIEKDQCEIISCLSLGYCRVKTLAQGKDIEKYLYSILPDSLSIDVLNIPDDLQLIICSSAAETVFQQSNFIDQYAIISEPMKAQVNIEVIHPSTVERKPSTARSSSSDGKFYINTTGSSINVISGDICETPVDMMICVSTSHNLRDSILRRAGPEIESQYKKSSKPNDALLLDGGLTKARKILFVPWQTEVEEAEITKTQKSLADLVKWCIEQTKQRDLKSISFPPIGTGQLGLDPGFVCEAMIGAASEYLHRYKLDVSFVIYSSTGIDDDECYQVFRIYLDSLYEQTIVPTPTPTPTPTMNNERKKESIRRDIQSKRILILSDSSKSIKDHNSLIKSLEDLIYEKTFDLSLIESSFEKIDFLIDICLKLNVHPRLDYSRQELTLRGDMDSCFQCFFNLRQGKKVHQYTYEEKLINSYISLKIDEAMAVGESNISLKDTEQIIYHIDVNKLQIRVNKDRQIIPLVKKELNIRLPSSSLMIRTVEIKKSSFETLECFQIFQQTMSEWQIERIDSIENSPLYHHFTKNKDKTKLYFHGCSYSSVQSIIHYGLHSTNSSIYLTRDVLNSHLYGTHHSTDGKYYIFAVEIAKTDVNKDFISLSNDETCLALPTHLIVYQKRKHF